MRTGSYMCWRLTEAPAFRDCCFESSACQTHTCWGRRDARMRRAGDADALEHVRVPQALRHDSAELARRHAVNEQADFYTY